MTKEFYENRTVYQNGFDYPTYLYKEMKKYNQKKCKAPIFAGVRVTSYCNMKCPHCFAQEQKMTMSLDKFKKVVDILVENELYKITITGGEPFLNVDLLKMIEYVKSQELVVSLHTNGSLISDESVKVLKEILDEHEWIQVSLDGYTYETYQQTRENKLYNLIINNIKILVEHDINVKLNVVVTNKNYKFLNKIYEKAVSLKVKMISFSPLYGSIDDHDDVYYPTNEEVYEEFKKVIELYETGKKNIVIDADSIAVPWGCSSLKDMKNGRLICPAGKTSVEIDVNGDVYPCPFLFDKNHFMGNIFKNSLNNIWNNNCIDELVSEKWVTEKVCQECEFNEECLGGCYAVAVNSNYNCDIRCDKIRREYYDATFKKCVC